VGLRPLLSFEDWKRVNGFPTGGAFTQNVFVQQRYDDYVRQWRGRFQNLAATELSQNPEKYALPAEAAQRFGEQNFRDALGILERNRSMFTELGRPGDPYMQGLIGQMSDFNAAALGRAKEQARNRVAASGLGTPELTDRLLQEDFNRRQQAGIRDIGLAVGREGRAGLAGTNQQVANILLNRSFQLPESGVGRPAAAPAPTGTLFGPSAGQPTTQQPAAPIGARQQGTLDLLRRFAPQTSLRQQFVR
jgi:hypothetical protein